MNELKAWLKSQIIDAKMLYDAMGNENCVVSWHAFECVLEYINNHDKECHENTGNAKRGCGPVQ